MKLSQETKEAIKEAEADVKAGRVYSLEEVKKELGIWFNLLSKKVQIKFCKVFEGNFGLLFLVFESVGKAFVKYVYKVVLLWKMLSQVSDFDDLRLRK